MKKAALLLGTTGLIAMGFGVYLAFGSGPAPSDIAGCVYSATPPSLSDGQTVAIQCTNAGKIIVH